MKALVIVDMENDFMSTGALGVKRADEVIPIINELMKQFSLVVATKDWHPPNHCSFAKTHPGKKVGDTIDIQGRKQILWPVHCVQNTPGAEFVKGLHTKSIAQVFFKGTDPNIDSYSAFYDNARQKSTGLAEYLKSQGVTHIYLAGLTTEYCVLYSALDALEEGFQVTVVADACRGINLKPGDDERALVKIAAEGGIVLNLQ